MHIAVIMDGNGRWATARGLPRTVGHYRGASVARKVIEQANEMGLSTLTLYAFSTENWIRPKMEVDIIFGLISKYIKRNMITLKRRNVHVRFIGSRSELPETLCTLVTEVEAQTVSCTGLQLNIALNYGGRDEILRMCRAAARAAQIASLPPEEISVDLLNENSDLCHCSQPDLIVRTGGDRRLSNFLLWHVAYSELYFSDTLWPDFSTQELSSIISEVAQRDRRFGGLSHMVEVS
ncbi:MAG: polyprenyl diphosphate synthase [Tabrizicola sp.]